MSTNIIPIKQKPKTTQTKYNPTKYQKPAPSGLDPLDPTLAYCRGNSRRLIINTVQLDVIKRGLEFAIANGFIDTLDEFDTPIGQRLIDMIPDTIAMDDTEMLHGFTL